MGDAGGIVRRLAIYIPVALVLLYALSLWRSGGVKVACVGDSITFGSGAPPGWDYPSQLQRLLGRGYRVRNFGVSGATMLSHGNRPYVEQPAFAAALNWHPDVVILMLGANDTKPVNWDAHGREFEPDCRALIARLKASNPAMKLFLCRPSWIAGTGHYGITEEGIAREIPILDKIAVSMGLAEIDMHAALLGHPEDLPDHVHPNRDGAARLAAAACGAIKLAALPGPDSSPAP